MHNPRDLVPESNMPAYPWLETNLIDPAQGAKSMNALSTVGVPYSQQDIDNAAQELSNVTEQAALIAYLQSLGRAYK